MAKIYIKRKPLFNMGKKSNKVKEEVAVYENNFKQFSCGFLTLSSPISQLWDNEKDDEWEKYL